MSDTSGTSGQEAPVSVGTPRWIPIVLGIVVVGLLASHYMAYQSSKTLSAELAKTKAQSEEMAKQLDQVNDQMKDDLAELKANFGVTSQKLGLTQAELSRAREIAKTIREEQRANDEQLKTQLGQLREESETKLGKISGDVTGAKSDIEATRKDLEATKVKLERTYGDLGVQSGLIARNREELEELKRRGERNVFDFDLRKAKDFARVGPVQMQLKKVDVKKNKYTLQLIADDKSTEKKDKTVNEPVQFYMRGVRIPYEIVVYEVSKDRIVGYLTTPKEVAQRSQ